MITPDVTLRSSLEKHNDTFESLLKLIPAKYYIPQDDNEQVGPGQRVPRNHLHLAVFFFI